METPHTHEHTHTPIIQNRAFGKPIILPLPNSRLEKKKTQIEHGAIVLAETAFQDTGLVALFFWEIFLRCARWSIHLSGRSRSCRTPFLHSEKEILPPDVSNISHPVIV